jgi:hypothetical protein
MECNDLHESMIEVLYDEADEKTARIVEQHLKNCPSCRDEMASFQGVRRHMSAWKAPSFERRPFHRPLTVSTPMWRLAAAATLMLAAGGALGLSGVEIRYERGPWAVRLGRPEPTTPVPIVAQAPQTDRAIETLQASLQNEQIQRDRALMRQLERMIRESEARQISTRDARLADFQRAVDTQRRYDLARVTAGLSYLEGKNGANMARTTELMGYMLQASQRSKP